MRFGGYAVVDTLLTVLAAYLTSLGSNMSFAVSLFWWFFVGEALHIVFGVQTAFLSALRIKVLCD